MREAEIVELLRARDERGLEELLRHYGPLLKYIIKPILPDAHDVEDCLSEAAMRIWESISGYDAERGSFTAWATAIARNLALNMRRRKGRDISQELEDEPSFDATPEEALLLEERRAELKRALELLPLRERTLFYRKYYYLQPTERIAAEMGMTVRAVEGRLYRIRKKLRRLLGGDDNEA